jgi:hypothetical protein
MSTRELTVAIGRSSVRRAHLALLAAMLILTLAAGVIVGRATAPVSNAAATHPVILPLDGLAHEGIGAKVQRALNDVRVKLAARHLSGYSRHLGA